MTQAPAIPFDNSYVRLPERFYTRLDPTPVAEPALIRVNDALAAQLGIEADRLRTAAGLQALAGNRSIAGAEPIAAVYAGHQFGGWNPQLGDGRAILLGEVLDRDGQRFDIQLKGSGPTPYSRGGDGRAPPRPVLREYILSEAMAALGVPTSRALAAVSSGQPVYREEPQPGAVLTRVARSHIRIGTFEYFAARRDHEALQLLADHVIERHYPDIGPPGLAQQEQPYRVLLDRVVAAQAQLVARWLQLGFIHGVMNTDNMLLSGETIDYGPCAFMDAYHAEAVFSAIDRNGRYAFLKQPGIAHWNLASLAQALMPLLSEDEDQALKSAQEAIDGFHGAFQDAYWPGMGKKIGLAEVRVGDRELVQALLELMQAQGSDFTLTFRGLSERVDGYEAGTTTVTLPAAFESWLSRWRQRLAEEPMPAAQRQAMMSAVNPALIPRNHRVEEAIAAAVDDQNLKPFHRLVDALAEPYRLDPQYRDLALAPQADERVTRTFCGT